MDEKKTDELMEELLKQPKRVEVDGQSVENQSDADLIQIDRYRASKKALASGHCPLRITKMAGGGAWG